MKTALRFGSLVLLLLLGLAYGQSSRDRSHMDRSPLIPTSGDARFQKPALYDALFDFEVAPDAAG